MNPRTARHLTAWLGLIAMGLIVLAPLISQLRLAAHPLSADGPLAALCSAARPAAGVASSHPQDIPLSACGYCDLLNVQAALPTPAPALLVLVLLVMLATVPVLSMHYTPTAGFPSGRPRAPPLLRHTHL